jgi:hypothetical protein
MPSISIRPVAIDLSPEVMDAIRTELTAGGFGEGTLFIGEAYKLPEQASLMWMLKHEPVVLSVMKDELSDLPRATTVAREFVELVQSRAQGTATLNG